MGLLRANFIAIWTLALVCALSSFGEENIPISLQVESDEQIKGVGTAFEKDGKNFIRVRLPNDESYEYEISRNDAEWFNRLKNHKVEETRVAAEHRNSGGYKNASVNGFILRPSNDGNNARLHVDVSYSHWNISDSQIRTFKSKVLPTGRLHKTLKFENAAPAIEFVERAIPVTSLSNETLNIKDGARPIVSFPFDHVVLDVQLNHSTRFSAITSHLVPRSALLFVPQENAADLNKEILEKGLTTGEELSLLETALVEKKTGSVATFWSAFKAGTTPHRNSIQSQLKTALDRNRRSQISYARNWQSQREEWQRHQDKSDEKAERNRYAQRLLVRNSDYEPPLTKYQRENIERVAPLIREAMNNAIEVGASERALGMEARPEGDPFSVFSAWILKPEYSGGPNFTRPHRDGLIKRFLPELFALPDFDVEDIAYLLLEVNSSKLANEIRARALAGGLVESKHDYLKLLVAPSDAKNSEKVARDYRAAISEFTYQTAPQFFLERRPNFEQLQLILKLTKDHHPGLSFSLREYALENGLVKNVQDLLDLLEPRADTPEIRSDLDKLIAQELPRLPGRHKHGKPGFAVYLKLWEWARTPEVRQAIVSQGVEVKALNHKVVESLLSRPEGQQVLALEAEQPPGKPNNIKEIVFKVYNVTLQLCKLGLAAIVGSQ